MIWYLFITLLTINAYDVTHQRDVYFTQTSCEMAADVVRQHAKKLKRIDVAATCLAIDESDP